MPLGPLCVIGSAWAEPTHYNWPVTQDTFTLIVSALVATGIAVSAAVGVQSSRDARVDAIFKEFTAAGSPGCTAGVYEGGRVVHRGAYGMANLDHDVRLAPDSVFHVASVSKQFTAAAILLLAEDGKLSLDDDVRKFIPELPDFGRASPSGTWRITRAGFATSGICWGWRAGATRATSSRTTMCCRCCRGRRT